MSHPTRPATPRLAPPAVLLLLAAAACDPAADPESSTAALYLDVDVQKALDLPPSPFAYADVDLPEHFTQAAADHDSTPADNPIDDDVATLGRVLFYDRELSQNRTVACASCHRQEIAFTDDETLSEGFEGGVTRRHSMSLLNTRYYRNGAMFWDERAASVEHQVLQPIQDAVEMGVTLDELTARVAAKAYYPPLFEAAFGDDEVTVERAQLALAQFVRSIVSYRSRWDEAVAGGGDPLRDFASYSAEENRGKRLFFEPAANGGAGCAVCHLPRTGAPGGPPPGPGAGAPNLAFFYVDGAANNGLTAGADDEDLGLYEVTERAGDLGRFKSPSLRNVALTAPYMHDASLATLREVIDHYADGVLAHPNLDPRLREGGPGGPPRRLNLSDADKNALEAFLATLTDASVADEVRWADPFRDHAAADVR